MAGTSTDAQRLRRLESLEWRVLPHDAELNLRVWRLADIERTATGLTNDQKDASGRVLLPTESSKHWVKLRFSKRTRRTTRIVSAETIRS